MPVKKKKQAPKKQLKKSARKRGAKPLTPAEKAKIEFEPLRKNLFEIKAIGRPLKYKTPDDMAAEMDSYFLWIKGEYYDKVTTFTNKRTGRTSKLVERICVREPEPPTVTGLILYLGFVSRDALLEYQKTHPEFSDVIRFGRLAIEHGYEKRLHGERCTGAIFALKNFGWKDVMLGGTDDGQTVLGFNYLAPAEPKKQPAEVVGFQQREIQK